METNLLSIIIFAPLAGAAINWFVGRRVRDEPAVDRDGHDQERGQSEVVRPEQ